MAWFPLKLEFHKKPSYSSKKWVCLTSPKQFLPFSFSLFQLIYFKMGSQLGHNVDVQPLENWERKVFGNGQIIRKTQDGTSSGSDLRADGCALGWNF